jgi:LysM repeat protein
MFEDWAAKGYLRSRQPARGRGRILLVAAALLLLTAKGAYGSGPDASVQVMVNPGDTVWSIASAHYAGDPRPHVDAILARNHLRSPVLWPGQVLTLPSQ